MVSLDEALIARLSKGSRHFEIFVDPDGALEYKKGKEINIEDILATESVFTDARKGEHAPEKDLVSAFGTADISEIAANIIKHGELQLTQEQRKHILEEKTKQVINIIAQNAINPQTRTPHPPARIQNALEEAKFHIDPLKTVDDQVNAAMKVLRPLIPIRFEEVDVEVRIPAAYAGKSYGDIARFSTIVKEEWLNDGSWCAVVRMPAGIQNDFYGLVNHLTKGDAETRLL
jgi:ribosome maturation protein SDO1